MTRQKRKTPSPTARRTAASTSSRGCALHRRPDRRLGTGADPAQRRSLDGLVDDRAGVSLHAVERPGLGQDVEDELGRSERGLDRGDPARDGHRPSRRPPPPAAGSGRRLGRLQQLDPGLEVADLEELHRRQAGADEDPRPGDRVLHRQDVGGGDLQDALDRLDRAETGELVGRRDRPLALPAEPAEALGVGQVLGPVGVMEPAQRRASQGWGAAAQPARHLEGAAPPYHGPT